jgi:hypothetical protein
MDLLWHACLYVCGGVATLLTAHKVEGSSGPPGIFWE